MARPFVFRQREKRRGVPREASALFVEAELGDAVFSHTNEVLEQAVGRLLRERSETLAAAESCTGGLLAEKITAFPGSSDYFTGSFVTYTNAANVFFGLADAIGADMMVDDGLGPKTTASGAGIYANDGSLLWAAWSSKSTTQTSTRSTATAASSTFKRLKVVGTTPDSANYELTFFEDNYPLFDSNGVQIKHTLAHSSATEMDFGIYAKAGGTGQLTVTVDYLYAMFKR